MPASPDAGDADYHHGLVNLDGLEALRAHAPDLAALALDLPWCGGLANLDVGLKPYYEHFEQPGLWHFAAGAGAAGRGVRLLLVCHEDVPKRGGFVVSVVAENYEGEAV